MSQRPFDPHSNPWERQPDEPEGAFWAFSLYRGMGRKRSLLAVTRGIWENNGKRGNRPTQISGAVAGWSADWRWVERCALYAAHLEKKKLEVLEDQRQERIRQWIDSFQLMHEIGNYSLRVMAGQAEAAPVEDPNARMVLRSCDLPKWMETALRAEFDLRGNPGAMLAAMMEAEAIDQGVDVIDAETPAQAEAFQSAAESYILQVAKIRREAE